MEEGLKESSEIFPVIESEIRPLSGTAQTLENVGDNTMESDGVQGSGDTATDDAGQWQTVSPSKKSPTRVTAQVQEEVPLISVSTFAVLSLEEEEGEIVEAETNPPKENVTTTHVQL